MQSNTLHCRLALTVWTATERIAMNVTTRAPTPYELGQQVDPETTGFVARLEDLPDTIDQELARRMREGLWESDRLADDVVVEFEELGGRAGWQMLDRALRERSAPASA